MSLATHGFPGFWDSIPKRCKGVICVDLGESFPTSISLQNLASIQPRTSLFSFFNFSPALVIQFPLSSPGLWRSCTRPSATAARPSRSRSSARRRGTRSATLAKFSFMAKKRKSFFNEKTSASQTLFDQFDKIDSFDVFLPVR